MKACWLDREGLMLEGDLGWGAQLLLLLDLALGLLLAAMLDVLTIRFVATSDEHRQLRDLALEVVKPCNQGCHGTETRARSTGCMVC